MKKLQLLLCAVALIMTSCTLSNEDKAEKLIKETLKDYLTYPFSYKPILTRVDSMFIDAAIIEPVMEISHEINNLISKIAGCERKIESAESSMDIWAPEGHSSQFSRGMYARAKKEKEKAQSDLDKYTGKLQAQLASLKENAAKYYKGEFTGWAVSHRFKSFDGEDFEFTIREMIFFCDEEFASCIGYETGKIKDLANIMKAVGEATSDEDIIDYFKEKSPWL